MERKRERRQECNPQKKKTKKPRTRRVSKYTLFLHHPLSLPSLSRAQARNTERCGKTLHNSSPVKKNGPVRPENRRRIEGLLACDDRLASSPPRLAPSALYICIYCILTTCNVRQTDRQYSTSWGVKKQPGGGVWTVSQLVSTVSKYLCVWTSDDVFCFSSRCLCVCLGKVPPCVAVNQYIFSSPLAQIQAPASGGEEERGREMRRNLGVRNVGVIDLFTANCIV